MIGASFSMMTVVTVNDPVTPVFSAPAAMTSTNTPAGSGAFSFQFNATKRTATTSTTGSVSGSGASSFQYFNSGALVDPQDYEVMVNLGTNAGFSNIATAGGSATLGVWHTLSTSPLFSFTCSARRGGSRPIDITVRHRVNTGVTATTSITMNQSSDAVTPVFTGLTGTTTVIKNPGTTTYLGLYIDSDSSAGAGRLRTYRDGALNTTTGFTFNLGGIDESEYEFYVNQVSSINMSFGGTALNAWTDIAGRRSVSPDSGSGGRFSASYESDPGTGVLRLQIRHKLDNAKIASQNVTFETL